MVHNVFLKASSGSDIWHDLVLSFETVSFDFGVYFQRYNVWGPFLVVAPASTLNNWHQEFSRFLPEFKILPYWGTTSERKILRLFWNQVRYFMPQTKAGLLKPFFNCCAKQGIHWRRFQLVLFIRAGDLMLCL